MNRSNIQRYRHIKKGNYDNPFFPKLRPTQNHTSRHRIPWGILITPIAVLTALIAAQEHPYLHVSNVAIDGARLIDGAHIEAIVRDEIAGRRWGLMRNDHIALIPKHRVTESIQSKFAVATVTIDRDWPNTLRVQIGEREPAVRYYIPPRHFSVLDKDGIAVFAEITSAPSQEQGVSSPQETAAAQEPGEPPENTPNDSVAECTFCDTMAHVPLVTASTTPPGMFKPGITMLPAETTAALLSLYAHFADLNIPINDILLDESSPETAEIRTQEGFAVYIDLAKEINAQIANLSVLIKEKYPAPPRNLKYIDVRYGNRLYYQ